MEILRVLLSGAINTFFATAWYWTGLAVKKEWVTGPWEKRILALITIFAFIKGVWSAVQKPSKRSEIHEAEEPAGLLLTGFVQQYQETMTKTLGLHPPEIRVNVMIPVKGFFNRNRGLRIFFSATNSKPYSEPECIFRWKQNQGACGWAWKHHDIALFDSKKTEHRDHAERLGNKVPLSARKIRSAISVPIWRSDKVVGIFNADCKKNENCSGFFSPHIILLARRYGSALAPLCPTGGARL